MDSPPFNFIEPSQAAQNIVLLLFSIKMSQWRPKVSSRLLLNIQIRMSDAKADSKGIFRIFNGHNLLRIQ